MTHTFQPRESLLDRRPQRYYLKPIIEEDLVEERTQQEHAAQQSRRTNASHLRIEAWLSPMSDHFPTPRGNHYLSAPILPSSPSTMSADDSCPTTFTRDWARASATTEHADFFDLYDLDLTDDDEFDEPTERCQLSPGRGRSQVGGQDLSSMKKLTPLVIPPTQQHGSDEWSSAVEQKKTHPSVALASSAKLPMSPAQRVFIGMQQAVAIPAISAPPSLDGSSTSDQLASMSSPPTPVIGSEVDETEEQWSGVRLQPGALATLNALSGAEDDEESIDDQLDQLLEEFELPTTRTTPPSPEMQQQSLRLITSDLGQPALGGLHSALSFRHSIADLGLLDIPSPGGFFGALSPQTREAWNRPALSLDAEILVPPTSTTAEQFYRCPWNVEPAPAPALQQSDPAENFYRSAASLAPIVEQVIEVPARDDDDFDEEDLPTARPINPAEPSAAPADIVISPASPTDELTPPEIVVDYDPDYARKQQSESLSNLERTEQWLLIQRSYLNGVDDAQENLALKAVQEPESEEPEEVKPSPPQTTATTKKKQVRFSEAVTTSAGPVELPSKMQRQESAYYRAFQDYVLRTHVSDVFVHQLPRFEALQAQRCSLRPAHHNQLLGKHQLSVVPQSAKKRLSANVARGDDALVDDPEKLRKEKEAEAMKQMTMSTWHVAAIKFLNGGRLFSAPVTSRLARMSRAAPTRDGLTRDRSRILDLGGQSTCDWAWHCAFQYPNAKIYTVTTKAVRQLSNSNIRGPSNHRRVAVERLTKLPFLDNQFDLVYARELHSLLKLYGENGEDEWETCLRECMRVLKPGGHLEFSLLDSDIMNAGPLGNKRSVEFGYSLQTLGYDPSPTKSWLARLSRAGFQDVRRAWLCQPLGAKPAPAAPKHDSTITISGVEVCQPAEEEVMGSTDNIASICSMVAGWSWERWLLRCQMEKVAGDLRLADTVTASPAMKEAGECLLGVNAVMEEGRNCRAGFRMLNGYARKPHVAE